MLGKTRLAVLSIVLIVVLIFSTLAIVSYYPSRKTFIWVYRFPQLENDALANQLSLLDVDGVFLSVSPPRLDRDNEEHDTAYAEKVIDFISSAQKKGIAVHALAADEPTLTFLENHPYALKRVDDVLKFNQDHPDKRFVGIQLDIEPWILKEWKGHDWNQIRLLLQQYVDLVSKIRESIEESGQQIVLSTTFPWWYNQVAAEGHLPSSLMDELVNQVDWLVPLVYSISSEDVPELTKDLEYLFAGSPVMIGLNAHDFDDYETLQEVISGFNGKLRFQRHLIGFALFEFDQLSTMLKERT